MATIGTLNRVSGKFALRANFFFPTKEYAAEYRARQDKVLATISEEMGIPKEEVEELPDDNRLGPKAEAECKSWVAWLMETDRCGDYNFL